MPDASDLDDKALLQKFAGVLGDFGEWLADTLGGGPGHDRALRALVDDLGGRIKPGAPLYTKPSQDGIKAYRDAVRPDLEAWFGLIADVRALVESVRAIAETAIDTGDAEATAEEITQSLLDLLVSNYVRERWPRLHVWMEFARFGTEPMTLFGPHSSASRRFAGSLKALLKFALAPLRAFAGPPMQTEADARKWSDATFLHLAGVFAFASISGDKFTGTHSAREIGLDVAPEDETLLKAVYGWDQPAGALGEAQLAAPIADDVSERMLSVQIKPPPFADSERVQVDGALRFTLAWVPAEHGGKGLLVSAAGSTLRCNVALGDKWSVQAEARIDAPTSLLIGGNSGFALDGPLGERQLHLDASLASKPMPAGQYGFRFSLGGENGFHIGRIGLSAVLERDAARAQIAFHDCRLALDGASFDEFIGSLLPRTQTSVEFSFGAGVSTRDGLFTTGDLPFASGHGTAPSAALARSAAASVAPPDLPVVSTNGSAGGIPIQIPIGKSLGPVRLHHVLLNLDRDSAGANANANESPKTRIDAALSFSARIGPVEARIDRIGLKLGLDFPDDPSKANLHFANLDVGLLPPAGIGLAVDARQVKGGGFLFHDEARHMYAGVMELSLSGIIALKAIGLISTRLPDGGKGYSLLILVTAENTNEHTSLLELPMGWRLTGIGGLIAVHRTFSEEALRAGLRNRTLESVLFPKDPVRNAPAVIAALDRVFPVKRGSYLFGVIVRLVWGVPTIITLDLGLIGEWTGGLAPSRLVVLGRIRSVLPRIDHDLLRLNLDAIGVFDFDQGTAAIDAVLVDSRLLNRFPITGAAALRARWKSPRSFALAVGGMNKGFSPPAGFPALERVALSLTTGDNPRLRCEAYFALTSNTVQFGAHAQFYAAAYGFSVQGEAGFDVLIRLLPFHFLAEFHAGMQLKKGSRNLFKVKVEGALEGPVPLALRAKCTFEIFWWDVSIRVNVTLAGGTRPPLPVAVDASAQLRTALADARSWSAELPAGQTRIVKLREPALAGDVRVHPLGTLAVRQSVVPLNLGRDIDRFGESPIAGARRFTVTGISVGGAALPNSPLHDDFAPAQFFEMDDDARIASPSFEPMQAGLRIGAPEFSFGFGERTVSPLDFETRIVDRSAGVPPEPAVDYHLSDGLLYMQALHGAAGRSVLPREPAAVAAAPFARLEPARWKAVSPDLVPLGDPWQGYAEALGEQRGARRRLVVREFEMATPA